MWVFVLHYNYETVKYSASLQTLSQKTHLHGAVEARLEGIPSRMLTLLLFKGVDRKSK